MTIFDGKSGPWPTVRRITFLSFLALAGLVAGHVAVAAEDESGFDEGFGDEDFRPFPTIWDVDFTRHLDLDLVYVAEDSHRFGQFNGLDEKGFNLIGKLDFVSRPGRDATQTTRHWAVSAENLGLKTGAFNLTAGSQGSFRISFDVDALQSVGNDTGVTPFVGGGSGVLTLPAGWTPSVTTGGMDLSGPLAGVDPMVERSRLGVAISKTIGERWAVDAHLSYEDRDGVRLSGAALYIDSANPHAALLPEPIDYKTVGWDVAVAYAGESLQFQAAYLASEFDNNDTRVAWQNPYAAVISPDLAAGSTAALGMPSDTSYQRLSFKGSYVFSPKIRVQLNGTVSESELEDSLLPYTSNPNLVVHTALPVTRIRDPLETDTLNAALLLRPTARVTVSFRYRYAERDNTMDVYPWLYVRGDATDQPDARSTVFNQPRNTTREKYSAEASLRLENRSRLSIVYEFDTVERTLSSVDETEEDTVKLTWRVFPIDNASVRLELGYGDLAASTYNWSQSFFFTYDVSEINRIPDNQRWSNHPLLRQFHLANRNSLHAKADVSYQITDSWGIAANLRLESHDYHDSRLGLSDRTTGAGNIALSYQNDDGFEFGAWANFTLANVDQRGRSFRGGIEKPANDIFEPLPEGSDPSRDWTVAERVDASSLGLNLLWTVVDKKLDIEVDYVYMVTGTTHDFEVFGAVDLSGQSLHPIDTKLQNFKLTGRYHFQTNLSMNFIYEYYRYDDNDWAREQVAMASMRDVLGTGEFNPDDDVNVIGLSLIYRW